MRVALVIPTYFDSTSVVAGAERYAVELAKALARRTATTLITFAARSRREQLGPLSIRYHRRLFGLGAPVNPITCGHLGDVARADVVHCLQFRTVVTELAALTGAMLRKKVFVTDLAGGVRHNLSSLVPVWKSFRAFLPISESNRRGHFLERLPTTVIYGGVDPDRFAAGGDARSNRILFVGRILPFKGLDVLIRALDPDMELDVVGQAPDPNYLEELRAMAAGRQVMFQTVDDDALVEMYRRAAITAIPSLVDGGYTTALESMACATPIIATDVGSLPELVADGETGTLVAPGDPVALNTALRALLRDTQRQRDYGRAGRARILRRFTWDQVAERCLQAYSA